MHAKLCLFHARFDRSVRSARALRLLPIVAAVLTMLAPESALADGETDGDSDLWTRIVLAAVRVILWVLQLPPIYACPC